MEYLGLNEHYPLSAVVLASFLAVIVCGILGNSLAWILFADKSQKTYITRDGVYFRWIAVLDFLICIVVLPYCILYEALLVKSDILCKCMEFVRHVLFYTAHLALISYSLELPYGNTYLITLDTVCRNTLIIVPLSFVCSIPTVFIFQAEIFISDTFMINSTIAYLVINGVLYLASAVVYVSRCIKYMEIQPRLGRKSIFVDLPLPDVAIQEAKRRRSTAYKIEREKRKASMRHKSRPSVAPPWSSDQAEKDATEERIPSTTSPQTRGILKPSKGALKRARKSDRPTKLSIKFADSTEEETSVDPPSTELPEENEPEVKSWETPSSKRIDSFQIELTGEDFWKGDGPQVPLCKYFLYVIWSLLTCRCRRRLPVSKPLMKRATYKRAFMFLIFMDLLIVAIACILWKAVSEESLILNFVHYKSIFGFFLITLYHKDLRRVVWGVRFERSLQERKSTKGQSLARKASTSSSQVAGGPTCSHEDKSNPHRVRFNLPEDEARSHEQPVQRKHSIVGKYHLDPTS